MHSSRNDVEGKTHAQERCLLVENYSVGVLVVLGVQGVVIVSSSLLSAPMPTRPEQGYADNLCRHPMPTGLTHGPRIGRESLPKGYADKGMPTTWARATIFPGPPPGSINVRGADGLAPRMVCVQGLAGALGAG